MENNETLLSFYKVDNEKFLRIQMLTKVNGIYFGVHNDLAIPFTLEKYTQVKALVEWKLALRVAEKNGDIA